MIIPTPPHRNKHRYELAEALLLKLVGIVDPNLPEGILVAKAIKIADEFADQISEDN